MAEQTADPAVVVVLAGRQKVDERGISPDRVEIEIVPVRRLQQPHSRSDVLDQIRLIGHQRVDRLHWKAGRSHWIATELFRGGVDAQGRAWLRGRRLGAGGSAAERTCEK